MNNVTAVLITRKKEYPKEIQLEGFGEIIVVPECPSIYHRYLAASRAKHDIIYVQDDDCLIDYARLWAAYDGRLTNFMTQGHFNSYRGKGATLVGWGCFFPKAMLTSFLRYIEKYGQDEYLLREADRIFTVLNQPHNTLISDHQDLATASDGTRMWQEPTHWTSMDEAIRKTCALL